MLARGKIDLKYNRSIKEYYIVWKPVVISAGKTKNEALEDLRAASHFCTDAVVDLKLQDINLSKEA